MHSNKSRIQLAVVAVLWTAVLAAGAWLAASHGRKEYAELTPVELLDGFTPTQVRAVTRASWSGNGGKVYIEASAKGGSYTMRVEKAAWHRGKLAEQEIWLEEVGPITVQAPVKPGSELFRAIQRSLQRALDAGVVAQETTLVVPGVRL